MEIGILKHEHFHSDCYLYVTSSKKQVGNGERYLYVTSYRGASRWQTIQNSERLQNWGEESQQD